MNSAAAEAVASAGRTPRAGLVVSALGVTQILAWGSSYYLLAVLAKPIADDTGWPLGWIVAGVSIGLLIAGLVSPRVGDSIKRHGGRPVLCVSAVLLAAGLAALAHALAIYLIAWVMLGVAMGVGLYDATFVIISATPRSSAGSPCRA
jgi:MFS family permease